MRVRVDADLNWRKGRYQRVMIEDIPGGPSRDMPVLFVADDETEVPGRIIDWDETTAWGPYEHGATIPGDGPVMPADATEPPAAPDLPRDH